MKKYETTIIIDPTLDQAKTDIIIKKYEDMILAAGQIIETEKWGKKRLAYPINKKPTGYYVHYRYEAAPEIPHKLEKDFLLNSNVMRFLTVVTHKKAGIPTRPVNRPVTEEKVEEKAAE